jgi:hypothetical protein
LHGAWKSVAAPVQVRIAVGATVNRGFRKKLPHTLQKRFWLRRSSKPLGGDWKLTIYHFAPS